MRVLLIIIAAFLCASQAEAQELEKSMTRFDSLSKVKTSTGFDAVDSVANDANKKINKLQETADKIKIASPEKISLDQLTKGRRDSLHTQAKITDKTDSISQKLQSISKVDSLFLFNSELRKVDSLKLAYQQKAAVIQKKLNQPIAKTKSSLDSLQKIYNEKIEKQVQTFQKKYKELWANEGTGIMGQADIKMPSVSTKFSSKDLGGNLPGLKADLPGANIPSLGQKPDLPNANLPNTSLNVPKLDVDPLKDVRNDIAKVGDVQKEVVAYQEDVTKIREEGFSKSEKIKGAGENAIKSRSELKALQAHEKELEKVKKLQDEYLSKVQEHRDPEKLKEEAMQKMKNVATDDLLSQGDKLQSAQDELGKVKKKYGSVQSMKNLPMRPLNPLRELPLRNRIIPGFLVNMSRSKFYSIDFAPQVYYRWTTRFEVGTGFVYRLNSDFKKPSLIRGHDLYGYKVFSNFKIYKGFYFRAEGERLNQELPVGNNDETYTRWTYTLLGGTGKEFNISKRVQGNTMVLFNVLHKHNNPYASKFIFRLGFNFSLKKDQRRQFIKSLKP